MSSHRTTNRHKEKPVNTGNIRQPSTASGVVETDIPQEEYPDGVRLNSRRAPANILRREEQLANLERVSREVGAGLEPDIPAAVERKIAVPGEISRITRNDVELFFDAAHAFRSNLANVLPNIADKLGKFILATPYTIIDSSGHPVQMVPDATAMTPAQAKLAGLVLHRLLPPLTDMDIDGKAGFGKGNHVDARQVRITVNTVNTNEHDPTDKRLREAGKAHPNAARQIAAVTMNLGEVVKQAQTLVGQIDGVDPQLFPDTLPGEAHAETHAARDDSVVVDDADEPPVPEGE